MDLKDKKLAIINRIINQQDEGLLDEINILLSPNKLEKLSQKEIVRRSEKAEEDYKSGRVYTTSELIKLSENW